MSARFVAIRDKKENLAGSIIHSPTIFAVASAAGPGHGKLWIGGKCCEWRRARRWAGSQKIFELPDASCLMARCFKRPPWARSTFSASPTRNQTTPFSTPAWATCSETAAITRRPLNGMRERSGWIQTTLRRGIRCSSSRQRTATMTTRRFTRWRWSAVFWMGIRPKPTSLPKVSPLRWSRICVERRLRSGSGFLERRWEGPPQEKRFLYALSLQRKATRRRL